MSFDTPPWASRGFDYLPSELPVDEVVAIYLDGLIYACNFHQHPNAKGLLVWLWATVGAGDRAPVIGKRTIGRLAGMHTLIISDPTLLQEPRLRIGMFFGDEAHNPIDGVVRIATICAAQLGLTPEEIVFAGTSSGGFAAVASACRLSAGAITLNAPLDLPAASERYPEGKLGRDHFRRGISSEDLARQFPLRSRGSAAYLAARSDQGPRLAIFQNVKDRYQYEGQFAPFCHEVGADVRGGISQDGNVLTELLDYPEGHRAIPEALERAVTIGSAFVRRLGPTA